MVPDTFCVAGIGRETTSGMTTAEIESVLGSEDLRNLLEVAEQSGAVKHAELAEVLEPLELDELEREALQREFAVKGRSTCR